MSVEENTSEITLMDRVIEMVPTGGELLGILKYKLSSPTTIWFVSLYIFSIMIMIVNNLFRVGFTMEGFLGGPEYYAGLFLNYGINLEGTFVSPYETGILAWMIAPFITIWMGLTLFYLRDSGYAYNANTRYMDPFLPAGDPFYAFFNDDVFGAGELLFGMKGNLFYITIVWFPIIAASILTVAYSRWTKRESWIVTRFAINFIIAVWIGIQMAKITDPNLSFSFTGFFESLFVHRTVNTFVVYSGQYHPLMLATVFAFFQVIPMLVFAGINSLISLYHQSRLRYELYQKHQQYIQEAKAEGIDKLPWENEESD